MLWRCCKARCCSVILWITTRFGNVTFPRLLWSPDTEPARTGGSPLLCTAHTSLVTSHLSTSLLSAWEIILADIHETAPNVLLESVSNMNTTISMQHDVKSVLKLSFCNIVSNVDMRKKLNKPYLGQEKTKNLYWTEAVYETWMTSKARVMCPLYD